MKFLVAASLLLATSAQTNIATMSLTQLSNRLTGGSCVDATSTSVDFSNGYCTCTSNKFKTTSVGSGCSDDAIPSTCPAEVQIPVTSPLAPVMIGCESDSGTYFYQAAMVVA